MQIQIKIHTVYTTHLSVLVDAFVVSTCVLLLFAFVYISGIFFGGYMYIRARFTPIFAYMRDYSGIGKHYICTMISAALLSCSVSSTNKCPRIK